MDFEKSLGQYTTLLDIEGKENMLSYPLLGQLFDAKVFNKMVIVQNKELTEKEYARGSTNNTFRPPGNPQLLSYDKENKFIDLLPSPTQIELYGRDTPIISIKRTD